jgi:O-antigen biosynthesis protein
MCFLLNWKTDSGRIFEQYGGLGRGNRYHEYDRTWFRYYRLLALPTWDLGGTANAAFRASIFADPNIGLMEETLGPGMPSGVGEDTYCFYKILKAGHTIVYDPSAYVYHRHRQTLAALRRQIYNYSKGHVSYHLMTLLRDHDYRAVFQLLVMLPLTHIHRSLKILAGKSTYPLMFILTEIAGNWVGPLALLHSALRVKKMGRSLPRSDTQQAAKSMLQQ